MEAVVLAVVRRSVRASAEIWARRREERRRRAGPRAVVSEVPYTLWRYSSSVSSFVIVRTMSLHEAFGWFLLVRLLLVPVLLLAKAVFDNVLVSGTFCVLCRLLFFV